MFKTGGNLSLFYQQHIQQDMDIQVVVMGILKHVDERVGKLAMGRSGVYNCTYV